MAKCIFCAIIAKEAECSLVHEDERSIAFLPLKPVNPGHTLLMPKAHYEDVFHTPPEETLHLLQVAGKISAAQMKAFKPLRVGLVAMGLDADHTHFHLMPLHNRLDICSKAEFEGRVVRLSRAELDRQAELIRKHM